MAESVFDCKYGPSTIKIIVTDEELRIKQPMMSELVISHNDLIDLDFETLSNPLPMIGLCFYLIIRYRKEGVNKKKKIALQYEQAVNLDCMEFLARTFPEKSCLKPNEKVKQKYYENTYTGAYRVYAILPIAMLMTAFLVLGLMAIVFFVMPEKGESGGSTGFMIAGMIFALLTLYSLYELFMIMLKSRYILKTNSSGLTIKKMMRFTEFQWNDLQVGIPDFKIHEIYSEYWVNTDAFFVIPFEKKSGKRIFVKMTSNQTGKLFRELYYRDKVDYETARKAAAFF